MENVTIREIAKQAGVSIATVSRAVNPHTCRLVKKSTRNKVLAIVKKRGYLPSPVAKRLATGKSTNIAIFLGTRYSSIFYTDYYMKLLSGAMEVLEETQYNLIIRMIKHREFNFNLNKMLRGMDVAACIVCDFIGVMQVSLAGLEKVAIPVVVLNRLARKKSVAFFDCDNYKASYNATDYLIKLGHNKIAIVVGTYYEKYTIDRLEGYKSAIADNMIPYNEDYVYKGDFNTETGIKAITHLMGLADRPSAIFCTNDEIAIGAFMKLEAMGMKCPRDVSIMGFDGIETGRYLLPHLTTTRQPIYEMSREAMKDILATLNTDNVLEGIKIFDAQIIKGGTCAKYSAGHVHTKA